MRHTLRDSIHALAALLVGAIIYQFLRGVGGTSPAALARNYLPDVCWSYALSFALGSVFEDTNRAIWGCATVAFVCGGLWETIQAVCWVPGTADGWDVLAYLTGALLSVTIKKIRKGKDLS